MPGALQEMLSAFTESAHGVWKTEELLELPGAAVMGLSDPPRVETPLRDAGWWGAGSGHEVE